MYGAHTSQAGDLIEPRKYRDPDSRKRLAQIMTEISEGWTLAFLEEVVAFVAHARIPDFCIGVPGLTGKLVRVLSHRLCFTIKKKCY